MPNIESIGQIAIPVKDLARAVTFYRDVLGLQFLFQAPPQLAFFNCGGVRIMLDNPADKEFANHSNILYFKVSDINATYESFKSRGAEFVDKPHLIAKMPDHELWMTFLKDTEGNTLALMSEVRS
jgi:methylmalonyl-CoA/ethylmalonyl-CoA epimerase